MSDWDHQLQGRTFFCSSRIWAFDVGLQRSCWDLLWVQRAPPGRDGEWAWQRGGGLPTSLWAKGSESPVDVVPSTARPYSHDLHLLVNQPPLLFSLFQVEQNKTTKHHWKTRSCCRNRPAVGAECEMWIAVPGCRNTSEQGPKVAEAAAGPQGPQDRSPLSTHTCRRVSFPRFCSVQLT